MDPNYIFVRNTTFLARQYNWSNTTTTCRLSHYFQLKTCSSFLSHSQVFHLMFVIKYVTVLSGKYPANFTRIPDSARCLHFTGYRIVLSGSGTSLIFIICVCLVLSKTPTKVYLRMWIIMQYITMCVSVCLQTI